MITENLSTLKINKLTQEQYNRELEAGNLEGNALYLTPDVADQTYNPESENAQSGVAVAGALDEYYTKTEVNQIRNNLNIGMQNIEQVLTNEYYTKTEVDDKDAANKSYVDSAVDNIVNSVVPIVNGGTGATTAAAARKNLGIAEPTQTDVTFAYEDIGTLHVKTVGKIVNVTGELVWEPSGTEIGGGYISFPTNDDTVVTPAYETEEYFIIVPVNYTDGQATWYDITTVKITNSSMGSTWWLKCDEMGVTRIRYFINYSFIDF